MKNVLKSSESIIHPQHGNALHVYNAFIYDTKRLENENNGRVVLLDTSSWRATKKHSVGRSLLTPDLGHFIFGAKIQSQHRKHLGLN